MRDGSTVEAVRASIAMPALFTPVLQDDVTLVDGGLVNPVPVSLARAMGADKVIAVDLSHDRLGRRLSAHAQVESPDSAIGDWLRKLRENAGAILPAHPSGQHSPPSMQEVVFSSIDIMQDRISRSRMAGEPPDILVSPQLPDFHLLDFHRAKEAIEEGKRAVAATLHDLRALCDPPI